MVVICVNLTLHILQPRLGVRKDRIARTAMASMGLHENTSYPMEARDLAVILLRADQKTCTQEARRVRPIGLTEVVIELECGGILRYVRSVTDIR